MRRILSHRFLWRRLGSAALVAGVLCTLAACSTYSQQAAVVRGHLLDGKMQAALDELGNDPPAKADVLNLLQRGLLLHYEARYAESNEALQAAEAKIEDQYTKSISGEAFAFLTNDGNLPYDGYPHEQVLLHLYGALNYLFMGDLENSLVECRRVSHRLEMLERIREDKKGYTDDAFVEWLAGLLYAEDADGNAALVSARRAREAYGEYQQLWGLPLPPSLIVDHVGWARRFGFAEEAAELEELHPTLAKLADAGNPDEGELLVLYECGFVDALEESALEFPILESDDDDNDVTLAPLLMSRGHREVYVVRRNVKVKYWLRVAMPTMVSYPYSLSSARVHVGERVANSFLVEDVSAIARLTFEEGGGKRLLKTILRAIAKYKLTRAAEKKKGDLAGILANLAVAATERADTRSWTTLPDQIHIARMRLPAGTHTVTVEALDATGRVGQSATFEEVEIRPGEMTLLRHRSFH